MPAASNPLVACRHQESQAYRSEELTLAAKHCLYTKQCKASYCLSRQRDLYPCKDWNLFDITNTTRLHEPQGMIIVFQKSV